VITTYIARALFDGKEIRNHVAVSVEHGRIVSLSDVMNDMPSGIHLNGLLVPGFIDVQVNGGGGVLFNAAPNVDTLKIIAAAHIKFGTTAMLPTLITDKFSVMQQAADSIADAVAQQMDGVTGIHFEGPHLSNAKKGVHFEHFIRSVNDKELALFCRKDMGKVIVTLAPENVPVDVIADLVSQGVRICLGHSNANSKTVMRALEAGASGFTHLFNAMSPLEGREPGMVGCALLDKDSYCGLIVDHQHVHPKSCQLAIRTKGADRIMLVTDAMSHVGSTQKSLPYFDTVITRNGDKLTVPDGTLAGSVLNMARAVRNCHIDLAVSLEASLQMASSTPANYLGIGDIYGQLKPGYRADMVLLDEKYNVASSWIAGQQHVYSQVT